MAPFSRQPTYAPPDAAHSLDAGDLRRRARRLPAVSREPAAAFSSACGGRGRTGGQHERSEVEHLGTGPAAGLLAARLPAVLQLARGRGRHRGVGPSRRSSTPSRPSPGCRWSGSTSRSAPAAASRSSARRTRSSSDIILDKISLDYTETLQAAAGKQAEEALHETMKKYKGEYLMLVEGSVPDRGRTASTAASAAGRRSTSCRRRPPGAKAIVAWGSCASNGCIQAANPNPTGATPIHKIDLRQADHQRAGLPADRARSWPARSSTCWPSTASRSSTASAGRRRSTRAASTTPATAGRTTTPACSSSRSTTRTRGAGYCLYKMGCRGPVTYNACGVIALEQRRQLPDPVGPRLHRLQRGELLGQRPVLPAPGVVPGLRHRDDGRQGRRGGRRGHGRRHRRHAVATNIRKRKRDQARRSRRASSAATAGRGRRADGQPNRRRPDHPHRGAPAHRGRGQGRQGRRCLQLGHDGARLRDRSSRAATRATPGRSPSGPAASARPCTRWPRCAPSRTRSASRSRRTPSWSAT